MDDREDARRWVGAGLARRALVGWLVAAGRAASTQQASIGARDYRPAV